MMRKFKWFFDFDKEALWLNKMAGKGFQLGSKTFGYRFRKAKPVRANYKIDFRQFSSQGDFDDYLMLFRDSGWEHVYGTKTQDLSTLYRLHPKLKQISSQMPIQKLDGTSACQRCISLCFGLSCQS